MKCPECGYECAEKNLVCPMCSTPLDTENTTSDANPEQPANNIPPEELRKWEQDKNEQQRRKEERLKRKRKGHGFTGIITFAVLNVLFGLPESLKPMNLVFILVLSTLFGFPIGYVISLKGGGAVKGAFISSLTFAFVRILLSIPVMMESGNITTILVQSVLVGIAMGIIPGAIIGYHVSLSK